MSFRNATSSKIKEERVFRAFQEISISDFKEDLRKAVFSLSIDDDTEKLICAYNIQIQIFISYT